MKKFFDWMINRFSYIQIYIFICMLFVISLLPIAYFWTTTHLDHIRLIDEQLGELKEESVLKDLFNLIQQHRLLAQRSFNNPTEWQQELPLEEQIREKLKEAENLNPLKNAENLTNEASLWQQVNPVDIERSWNKLLENLHHMTARESESMHTVLLHEMEIEFQYLADRVGISYFEQIDKYVFIESIFLRLPSIQEIIAELTLICEKILTNRSKELSRDRLASLLDVIESDIDYYQRVLQFHATHYIDIEHKQLEDQLRRYVQALKHAIQIVKTRILTPPTPTISLDEFQIEVEPILQIGYQLWNDGLHALIQIFQTERKFILFRLWIVLLITILLTCFAFFLGLSLTYTGIKRLTQLTQATDSFTNGNLSVRVPGDYQDEIGRLTQAFNRMAQKLEEIINHLYELLNATSDLANGNLTARIQIHQNNSEFDQVALSFNKMAETFETIIGHLQQIGMMLTTSASEIAASSKEQETVVVEQETTTHEIAIAANEISSTVKEFAHTMNEVNQTAEQTSHLALKGKDSLSNMESIMHNMVDASTNIAAKLAILSEKASNITSVITTITKVADQTNLLSLNASIEAEKAGEYGRSFAVIAREIRRLADQTAIATLDIENMVNEIMTAISSSVMAVDDFTQAIRNGTEQVRTVSEQLATIIGQVQDFTSRLELVNQGMQAQSAGAEQINEAIAQLSRTAKHISQAIHQFHKTVQELNQAANELAILNPFGTAILDTTPSHSSGEEQQGLVEPSSKESKRLFSKKLTNLNVATNKLKDLNIHLHPPKSKS
jgi:methyl-accepting chemotaxis protein WspA